MSKSSISKECPRCKRDCMNEDMAMNSLSHVDRTVYICSKCGMMEGLVKLGGVVPMSEGHLTLEFEDWLRNRKKGSKRKIGN